MLPRERVLAALHLQAPDCVPLRIFPAPGGLYEHGARLRDLIRECGHDFGSLDGLALPDPPPPTDFDPDGSYHSLRTDAWGTIWEHRVFGVWGTPATWPLADLAEFDRYRAPAPPPCQGPDFRAARAAAHRQRRRYYHLGEGASLFERLHSLRPFEDVLMDIAEDRPEMHRLADLVCEHVTAQVRTTLELGADGVAFGDDFGTQRNLIFAPAAWRRFFKPRYRALFEPVVKAGKSVFFHCCGRIDAILPDLREIGVDVIWPQLTAFGAESDLAAICRDLGLVVELHPDRGETMQRGTPRAVARHVTQLLDRFGTAAGGSWLYLEIDPGFPWPNVEALFRTVMAQRS